MASGSWFASAGAEDPLAIARRMGFAEPMLRRGSVLAPEAGQHLLFDRGGSGLFLVAQCLVDTDHSYVLDVWTELDGMRYLPQRWHSQTSASVNLCAMRALKFERGLRLVAQIVTPPTPRWIAVEIAIGASVASAMRALKMDRQR